MSLPIQRAHLDGLVVFVAVAERRRFPAAATQLGSPPSAISQTIRALEQRVGAPLLSRTTRSVGLTEAGERLLVHARPAMEMLSLGLDAAASLGDDVSGRLRINLPRPHLPLLANRLLPDFLAAYPNVQLELCGDDNFIDIVEQGFDAGIRMARSVPTDMIAVPLTPRIRFAVIAAASYVRKPEQSHVTEWVMAERPQRFGWAPGDYLFKCRDCKHNGGKDRTCIGDKRAIMCADCAYALPDDHA